RRVYLDVSGRIPTAKQAAAFLDSRDPDKRAKLIEELLASPSYGEQFGRTWRDWIAPAELPAEGNGGNQPVQATQNLGKWFAQRFNAGAGWDATVRAVLTADGTLKDQPQGLFFSLIGDDTGKPTPAGAARAVGSLFLGMQLQCAECHDDPFKHHTQADYWGLAAFFRNVTWRFNGRYFDYVSEGWADPAAKTVTGPRDAAPVGSITIPKAALKNSGKVIPGRFPEADPLAAADGEPLRPRLAAWLASAENPYFARAFVNRIWAYFTSRGFVHPVDDLRADNPAGHPDALRLLAAEFVASGFDVRHLVRCITLTAAYQRTSRPAATDPPEAVAKFARMPVRVMAADALYDSLKLAFADPGLDLRTYDAREAARFGESSPVGTPYEEFAKLFATNEDDATDFTHGIPQLLALLNHPRLRAGGKAIDELLKGKPDPAAGVEALYLATLSRRPTAEEVGEATSFLARRPDPRRGYSGLLWVLVNRSEFLLVR
ncbi:MAG TPA: DUF1549 domain-containing protein, partial [Urbifossiella sp.]|nr:DUF1549 domain-containing protein [Urbifossiella sp.]